MRFFTRDSLEYMEIFHAQRMQFISWTIKGQPGGDIETYGITKALSRIPGCVPRFSCESHPTKNASGRFYIMLMATTEGHRHLSAILELMNQKRRAHDSGPIMSLIETANTVCITPVANGDRFAMMQTSIFEAELSRRDKREFLWSFQSTIDEYANQHNWLRFDDVMLLTMRSFMT